MNYEKLDKVVSFILKEFILLIIGGTLYFIIEVLYRGYSHLSMFLLGGICFVVIGLINEVFDYKMSLLKFQMPIAAIVVTVLEFITGLIVNKWLGLNVWDYSNTPFNVMGQICLPFTIVWYLLSGIAIVLDDYIRYFVFDEEKPIYKL